MAGPWEKYQDKPGPWRKYAKRPVEKKADPTEGMSGAEKFIAGFGKSAIDTVEGVKQAGTSAASYFLDSNRGLFGDRAADSMQRKVAEQQAAEAERRRLDAPLMRGAGFAGNVAGTLAQIVQPGVHLRGTAAAASFLPRTLKGNAAQGAVIGAAQPVVNDAERTGNATLGGVAGFVGSAIPAGGGKLLRLLRGNGVTASGAERRIAEVLRAEASDPQSLMVEAPSMVKGTMDTPGVQRTLAEETLDPGIARLERLLRSKTRGWDELDSRNNAARVAALREIGGDEGAIAAAEAERDAMSRPFLRAAQTHDGVDVNRLIDQLDRAHALFDGRPAVQSTLREVQELLMRPANAAEKRASPNWPDQVPRDGVGELYNVRKTIGDLMSGKLAGEKPAAQAATRELGMVKSGLDRAIGKATPMFKGYLEAYKQGSREVDRRKLGQYLIERGAGGSVNDAATGLPVLTPAGFSRLANNMDAAAAGATGFRKAKAERIFDPEDFATVNAIRDDLERKAFAATKGSGGNSHTFERFAGEGRLRSRLIQAIPLIRDAAVLLDEAAQRRLERSLAEVMQDPSKARAILLRLPANERRVVESALMRVGGTGGAVSPALAE